MGTRGSSQIAAGKLGLLLSCSRELGILLKLQLETQASTLVAMGILGFLSSWGGTQCSSGLVVGPHLELSWGDSSLGGMCRVAPVLLQCCEATHFFWHGTSLSLWSDSTL